MLMSTVGLLRLIRGQFTERLGFASEGVQISVVGRIVHTAKTYFSYRRALWQLNQLDDRDLDDLAIGRGELPALAWRHARAVA